jgi:predicted nucleic acid-binding protein
MALQMYALIAATMQENNLKTIYTENIADFKKVPWLNVVNPLK